MAFCARCGKMLPDSSAFCGNCGAKNPNFVEVVNEEAVDAVAEEMAEAVEEATEVAPEVELEATPELEAEAAEAIEAEADTAVETEFAPEPVQVEFEAPAEPPKKKGSAWWLVLGLLFPIVGLILFLVWRKKNPKSAKFVGIGAIIGGILELISYIILFFAVIIFIFTMEPTPDTLEQMTDIMVSWMCK